MIADPHSGLEPTLLEKSGLIFYDEMSYDDMHKMAEFFMMNEPDFWDALGAKFKKHDMEVDLHTDVKTLYVSGFSHDEKTNYGEYDLRVSFKFHGRDVIAVLDGNIDLENITIDEFAFEDWHPPKDGEPDYGWMFQEDLIKI